MYCVSANVAICNQVSDAIPTPNEIPRRGYRIGEAATYMGVSPWFVEEQIRSGELPALKLCRHYTVLREDMDNFLDSKVCSKTRQSAQPSGATERESAEKDTK
jgi:excisionase family DNA binding protein